MVRSSKLLAKLELEDLDIILRERRLHCFGHVEHCSGAVRTAFLSQRFVFILANSAHLDLDRNAC